MNRNLKRFGFCRIAIIPVILFSFILGSCSKNNEFGKRVKLIPEKDLVSVLTDVYLADGLMTVPEIRNKYGEQDSIQNYIDIIEYHGYTREDMDKTINHYFTKKPKKLITIYDKVRVKLSEMEALVDKNMPVTDLLINNLWKGDSLYLFPDPMGYDTLLTGQRLDFPFQHTISFTLTLFPGDATLNPRFMAYYCHPDSIENGRRDYFPQFEYIKDGQPHNFAYSKKPVSDSLTYLRVRFIEYYNDVEENQIHARIENITLTSIPAY
jgi:hypothetical protein